MPVLRPCLEPGCPEVGLYTRCSYHQRIRDHTRNSSPIRGALYGGGWAAHSRARRRGTPYCERCGTPGEGGVGLTVDHPTDRVLCRSCHAKLEAARREYAKK